MNLRWYEHWVQVEALEKGLGPPMKIHTLQVKVDGVWEDVPTVKEERSDNPQAIADEFWRKAGAGA